MAYTLSEVAYGENTSNTTITATSEATAQTIVTASAFTADGVSSVTIEINFTAWGLSATSNTMWLVLYEGSSSIGLAWTSRSPIGALDSHGGGLKIIRNFIPGAGSKTYSIRGFVDAGSGILAGDTGGDVRDLPFSIRILQLSVVPATAVEWLFTA